MKYKKKLKSVLKLIKKLNNLIVCFSIVMKKQTKNYKNVNIKSKIKILNKIMLIYQCQKNECYNYQWKVLKNFSKNYCILILLFALLLK